MNWAHVVFELTVLIRLAQLSYVLYRQGDHGHLRSRSGRPSTVVHCGYTVAEFQLPRHRQIGAIHKVLFESFIKIIDITIIWPSFIVLLLYIYLTRMCHCMPLCICNIFNPWPYLARHYLASIIDLMLLYKKLHHNVYMAIGFRK